MSEMFSHTVAQLASLIIISFDDYDYYMYFWHCNLRSPPLGGSTMATTSVSRYIDRVTDPIISSAFEQWYSTLLIPERN